jgi:hypothetical protein
MAPICNVKILTKVNTIQKGTTHCAMPPVWIFWLNAIRLLLDEEKTQSNHYPTPSLNLTCLSKPRQRRAE